MRSNRLPEIAKRSETRPLIKDAIIEMERADKEEFYAHYDGALDLKSLNKAPRRWERVYNTIRPDHSMADGHRRSIFRSAPQPGPGGLTISSCIGRVQSVDMPGCRPYNRC